MTIVRIGQLTAETRQTTNLNQPVSSLPTISSVQVHTGSFAYRFAANPIQFGLTVPTPATAYRLGYWLWHDTFVSSTNAALYRAANGTDRFEAANILVRLNTSASELDIVRPQTGTTNAYEVLATTAIPAALSNTNTWLHVGITHKIHDTDGFLSVYLDGARVLNLVGDTRLYGQGSGTPVFGTTASFIWGAGNMVVGAGVFPGTDGYVDDWYLDSYVGESDGPVPARIFAVRLPTGAGANADWTPSASTNVSNIEDNPNDGDSTYNKALAADLKDTFEFGDVSVPTDHRIIAEIPTVFAKNLDVGPLLRLHAYDGSIYAHSADLTPALDYTIPLFARFETQPDGSAWTETDANNMQWGYESRGSFA